MSRQGESQSYEPVTNNYLNNHIPNYYDVYNDVYRSKVEEFMINLQTSRRLLKMIDNEED